MTSASRVMWSELQNHDEPIIGALEKWMRACVVVNLFMLPDEPDPVSHQCVKKHQPGARGVPHLRHAADESSRW